MSFTDVSQLSPERKKEWEEAPNQGVRHQLVKIWELEDANAQAQATPSGEAGQKPDAPKQEPPKDAEPQPVVETKTQQQDVDGVDPSQTIEYWQKRAEEKQQEAENWKKRKGDADRHLEPTQQENAKLKAEKSALSEKLERLEAMVEKLASRATSMPDLDPDDEFDQEYGEVARRIKLVGQQAREEARRQAEELVNPLKEKLSFQENLAIERQNEAKLQAHFAAVKAKHPDIEDFIGQKYGPALVEWANTRPPYVQRIVQNPVEHDADDVSDIITQFKLATGIAKSVKSPAAADIAAKVNSHTNVAPPPIPVEVFPDNFTEKDFMHLLAQINRTSFSHDVIENLEKKEAEMGKAEAKWERTLQQRYKQ